jgi:ArsR family transcriptional regulator
MALTTQSKDSAADVLRAVGNENRVRVLHLLLGEDLCVCEVVDALGRPHYAVSRDLAALQRAGFVRERREGSWVYHSIAPEARDDPFRGGLLRLVDERLANEPQARADKMRLARRLALRVDRRCVVAVADVAAGPQPRLEAPPGGGHGESRDL